MTMLAEISSPRFSLDRLRSRLEKIGKEMELQIQLQHENIFKMMHRI